MMSIHSSLIYPENMKIICECDDLDDMIMYYVSSPFLIRHLCVCFAVDSRYVVHVSVHRNVKETWEMEIDLLGLLASLIKVDSHTC